MATRHNIAVIIGLVAAGAMTAAFALDDQDHDDQRHRHEHEDDHDRIRHAVENGQLKPLKEILSKAENSFPGQLIQAELEEHGDTILYEIKILPTDGRLIKLLYDARTGELLPPKAHRGPR